MKSVYFAAILGLTACGAPPKLDPVYLKKHAAGPTDNNGANAGAEPTLPTGATPAIVPVPVVVGGSPMTGTPVVTPVVETPPPVASYNPCPTNGAPCLIMPLGDSITFGVGSADSSGYRAAFLKKAWKANQNISFVGGNSSGPALVENRVFSQGTSGYSGYTTVKTPNRAGITELTAALIKTHKPHIVTLMIGTNDVAESFELDKMPERVGAIIDLIHAESETTLVVVAQIVPSQTDAFNAKVEAYNKGLPAIVKTRAAAGKNVILVDMYKALTANADYKKAYLADNVHPNNAGYEVMAGVWYEALKGVLPVAYDPCPAKGTPCSIMAFGDSITAGAGSSAGGSYRVALQQKAWEAKQEINFVGPNNGGPAMVDGKAFNGKNAGFSGYTISKTSRAGIAEMADQFMATYKPNIVTLMIGTNDVDIQEDLPGIPTRLGKLIDQLVAANPSTLIVVAKIVPTTDESKNTRVIAYNNAIPQVVKARADAGKHVVMVDMYAALSSNADYKTVYMNDTLHPKDAGLKVMADQWYAAIAPYLK